jgi:hypothetical protein
MVIAADLIPLNGDPVSPNGFLPSSGIKHCLYDQNLKPNGCDMVISAGEWGIMKPTWTWKAVGKTVP